VEQKNRTIVRDLLGDARLDTLAHQRLLDALYDNLWLTYNFFQPGLRLKEKHTTETEGIVQLHRKWHPGQTPLERL
jgi:hypothetical protein